MTLPPTPALAEVLATLSVVQIPMRVRFRNVMVREAALIQGLNGDQLFFLGFAQGWCTHETDESQRLRATIDTHSPPRERVNMPLSHFPGFWNSWQCQAGTPMHAAKPCEVW